MPRITLNLYAHLRAHVGGAATVEVDIQPGQTVREVLQSLGVPSDQTRVLFVNNRAASLSQPLNHGDRVGVFPAIGGG